jgi:hypothetical protein
MDDLNYSLVNASVIN